MKQDINSKKRSKPVITSKDEVIVYLCLHATTCYRSSPARIVGAGIYDTSTPKLPSGLKPIVISMMAGINRSIAERRLIKMLRQLSKLFTSSYNE